MYKHFQINQPTRCSN